MLKYYQRYSNEHIHAFPAIVPDGRPEDDCERGMVQLAAMTRVNEGAGSNARGIQIQLRARASRSTH